MTGEPVQSIRDRILGALIGLAVGDAVGTTVEFKRPGTFPPVTDMTGGGPFGLKPGQWADDTSMALCLAKSLTTVGRFDPVDQLQRYVRWWREGHLSPTGRCFDIGNQTRDALAEFQATGKPHNGPTEPYNAGNGSLMRLAPVPMAYWRQPRRAIEYAGESSKTTHGNTECVDACRYFAGLIVGAIEGQPKSMGMGTQNARAGARRWASRMPALNFTGWVEVWLPSAIGHRQAEDAFSAGLSGDPQVTRCRRVDPFDRGAAGALPQDGLAGGSLAHG